MWAAVASLVALVMLRVVVRQRRARPSRTASEKERADNLDVILTYVKERAATQNAQITALDGKANFGLAAASLLTTGIASLAGAFLAEQRADPTRTAAITLLPHLDR